MARIGIYIKTSGIEKIYQYDLNGNLIASYSSLYDASKATNVYRGNISRVIRGIRKTAGMYVWRVNPSHAY